MLGSGHKLECFWDNRHHRNVFEECFLKPYYMSIFLTESLRPNKPSLDCSNASSDCAVWMVWVCQYRGLGLYCSKASVDQPVPAKVNCLLIACVCCSCCCCPCRVAQRATVFPHAGLWIWCQISNPPADLPDAIDFNQFRFNSNYFPPPF